MAFTPQSFLSNIGNKGGLAKPNRFHVILNIPDIVTSSIIGGVDETPEDYIQTRFNAGTGSTDITRWLSMQCETAELPGKQLQTSDAKIYGPTYKVPYQVQYSDITLQFICSNLFYERKLFDRWLEYIIPNNTNNARFPKGKGIKGGYLTRIMIVQFNDVVKQIYAVELIDAFPISITAQPLNWADDNFHRVSVQFTYQKFKTIYSGGNENTVAEEVFGGIQSYERSVNPQTSTRSILYTDEGTTNRTPGTDLFFQSRVPVDLNLFNLKNQFTARYLNQQILQPYNTAKRQITDAFRF
jgi:hypothetical protein